MCNIDKYHLFFFAFFETSVISFLYNRLDDVIFLMSSLLRMYLNCNAKIKYPRLNVESSF